ncbi:MAG: fumarylacetoacetate hydrolase family protein [Acidaminococcaceae bacterium]|nr:fumarylacetoacetate hydrolase family protein [Acidaminococcaceae bacterium]
MRYYTILLNGEEKAAASRDGKDLFVLDAFADMNALIASGGIREIPKDAQKVSVSDAQLLSPIPRPLQDVLCLGINYTAHAEEAERFSRESFGGERPYPIFFAKRVCYSQGNNAPIPAYTGLVDSLDYECELGVIIGKDAKNVKRENVTDYIFGYTIVNDVSARNLQTRHKQWYFGKSLDGFTPMGPCIVSADEFAFPPKRKIRCRVNGEVRQDSSTGNLITGIADIITMLSEGMTLKAGTVIATGTPAGVGMGMTPPTFLKPGDVVECEIEGIGTLRNYVE